MHSKKSWEVFFPSTFHHCFGFVVPTGVHTSPHDYYFFLIIIYLFSKIIFSYLDPVLLVAPSCLALVVEGESQSPAPVLEKRQ